MLETCDETDVSGNGNGSGNGTSAVQPTPYIDLYRVRWSVNGSSQQQQVYGYHLTFRSRISERIPQPTHCGGPRAMAAGPNIGDTQLPRWPAFALVPELSALPPPVNAAGSGLDCRNHMVCWRCQLSPATLVQLGLTAEDPRRLGAV